MYINTTVGDYMKLNNKGFTMVELLVTMAIMGLLIIMAFPTIRAIQSNNTSTKFKEYGKSVLSASKLYVDSYEEDLFDLNDNNGMKSIDLNDLVKKDLLKDISMSDSTCLNGSSVNIIKYKDDYTYCLNLICTTGGKEVYKEISQEGKCKDLTLYKVTYSYGSNNHVVSVIQGNNHSILTPGAAHISIPNGYKFVKWISDIGEKKPGDVIEVNSDITFIPELEPFKYKLKFDSSLPDAGTMTDQECKVGKPCKIKNNEFSKDYYSFSNYTYNSKTYNPGDDIKNDVNITSENQVVNVTASFKRNIITINYYSNGGTLKPNVNQRCAIQAGCPQDESKCYWPSRWNESKGCNAKSGLVQTVKYYYDAKNFTYDNNGMPNYDDKNGSALYMTRSGCTGTHFWHVGSAASGNKINEYHDYTTTKSTFNSMAEFASDSRVGKGEAFKKGDITVDVFAGWNCPNSITCAAGKYLPKNSSSCATCLSKYYCIGGTFKKSTTKNQGLKLCPGSYIDGGTGLKNEASCALSVKAGYHVSTEKQNAVKCSNTYHSSNHTVKYGNKSNCEKNTITLKYYENGGKLTPGRSQRCMKKACNNFKNHALCKCSKYTSDVNVNDATNCINYSTCDKESGVALVSNNVLDTQYYSDGVRNYSGEYGATIYMTKSGYTATGNWYVGSTGSSKTINENATYKNEEDYLKNGFGKTYWDDYQTKNITIKLYAGWKVDSYTLKFDKDGGSGTCNNITKNYNTAWGTLCSPKKTGHTFGGWYTGKNGSGTKITNTSKATSNLTVYANWNPIQYTIKVVKKDSNIKSIKIGGTTTTSKKVNYGTQVELEAITKDYYHLSKWKHGSDSLSKNPLKITVTGNATYNAYSDKNQLTIHYYANGGKITSGPEQICPGDKRCLSNTGHIYKGTPDDYDSTVLKNTDGLRNYRYKKNSTLYLTQEKCTATGVWHVDSPSGKAVSEVGSYNQIKDLAKASGYESKFKKGNVEIKYYAGWKCN